MSYEPTRAKGRLDPFIRTIVDKMGMGAHLEAYNDQLETITRSIYAAFEMGDFLKVKG